MIRDNVSNGDWDWEKLQQDWDSTSLNDWGLSVPDWGNHNKLNDINEGDENSEWVGMPEFNPEDDAYKLLIHFESENDLSEFVIKHEIEILSKQKKSWSTKYPYQERKDLKSYYYEIIDEE